MRRSKDPDNPNAKAERHAKNCATMVAAVAIAIYVNSFQGQFVFDDRGPSILHNPTIRGSSSFLNALQPPSDATVTSRPLLNFSFAVNYALEGVDSNVLYHLVNVLIHGLNGVLLFGLIRRTLNGPRMRLRYGNNATELALACALVWVSHPLCTSCVTYIVQRAESLMAMFLLLTLYCCVRADEQESDRQRWTTGAILACALGMASKEVMAIVPLLVICYDWVFRASDARTTYRERAGLYAGLATTWLVLFAAMTTGSRSAVQFGHVHDVTSLDYAKTQLPIIVHYLRLVVWPCPLVFDYDWPIVRQTHQWLPYAPIVIPLGLSSLILLGRRWPIGFLGVLFFLMLGPSSSFLVIYKEVAAEHRMYLPAAAVLVAVILGVWNLGRLVMARGNLPATLGKQIGWTAIVGVTVAFSILTYQRNDVFRDRLVLWKTTAEDAPRGARPQYNLGLQYRRVAIALRAEEDKLRQAGALDRAAERSAEDRQYTALQMEQFDKALAIKPDYPNVHYSIGVEMQRLEKDDQAMEAFERSIAVAYFGERDSRPHNNLGLLLAKQGKINESIRCYRKALEINAGNLRARLNLANSLMDSREYVEAKKELETVLSARQNYRKALQSYAELLAMAPVESVRDGPLAIKIVQSLRGQSQQEDPRDLELAAAALAESGNFDKAAKIVQRLEKMYQQNGIERYKEMRARKIAYRSRRPFYLKAKNDL